jgi:colicin import membrane protein
MKKYFFAILIIAYQAINTLSTAQNKEFIVETQSDANSDTKSDANLDAKLAEIKQARLAIESSFKTREATCYKNFAVSNCLQDLKSEKLLALSAIKRQELEINDQKRQIKSDAIEKKVFEKAKKIAEKEQAKALNEAANSDVEKTKKTKKTNLSDKSEASSLNDPLNIDLSKLAEKRASAANQRVLEANAKQAVSQQKAQSRALKFSQSGEQEAKFDQKQLDAQARKDKLDKAAAEKTKPRSASLPIPSTVLTER